MPDLRVHTRVRDFRKYERLIHDRLWHEFENFFNSTDHRYFLYIHVSGCTVFKIHLLPPSYHNSYVQRTRRVLVFPFFRVLDKNYTYWYEDTVTGSAFSAGFRKNALSGANLRKHPSSKINFHIRRRIDTAKTAVSKSTRIMEKSWNKYKYEDTTNEDPRFYHLDVGIRMLDNQSQR